MEIKTANVVALALVPAAMIVFSSCSTTPEGEGATLVAAQKGVPGGVMVETYQITATVTAIDAQNRKVTLVSQDGKKEVFKAGPEVVNFNQIQVGDQVKATATEQLVVFMATDAPPQDQGAMTMVSLAPVGAKPGGMVADTVQVKATIAAIDLKKHKATLEFPDGSKKTFAARKDVDLTQRKLGEEVVIRCTEAVAITVEKP